MTEPDAFVLGVDLDGVCAEYNEGIRQVLADERGIRPDQLPAARSWDFLEWGLDAQSFGELHRRAVLDRRMLRDLPIMEGCAEALWRLSDAGVWIRIITHRLALNWGHQVSVSDTVDWLDRNQIPYRDLCFLGRKPEVEAHAYIEDAPHNIEALRAGGNTVIVFDQPYNDGLDGPRARDWVEVEQLVTNLVVDRQGALQPQLPGVDPGTSRLTTRIAPPSEP